MFGLISNQLIYRQKRWLKQAFSLIQMMIILMVLVVHFILKVELDGKIVMIHRKKRRNNKVEHAKRKDICYFARLDKDEKEWTVEDFLRLLAQRKASMMYYRRYHKDQNMAAIVDLLNGMLTPNISFAAIA
uniref:Transposase n=1 Tax=Wuchereria bancrofti TaxID=6293 RepID=A0AAF5Q7A8_WUCBA